MSVREAISQSLKPTWIDLDRHGYMKSLRRNGMFFIVSELLQNSWDSDATEVAVTLSQPSNGKSKLTCVDNSPKGYTDLSHAHTLFAESEKKHDTTKRGRFNAGEKQVLCMMEEAEISSTTGTLTFLKNGKRRESNVGTKVGSSFTGTLTLAPDEYDDIVKRVQMVIPSIPTTFNGAPIVPRTAIHDFDAILPTEASDASGILRPLRRKTRVRLYQVLPGETAMLYEKGLPVVEINCAWHVDVQQRLPLNTERNNVTPAYHKAICVAVVNEMAPRLTKEIASEDWVKTATSSPNIKPDAFTSIMDKRYGKDAVLEDTVDPGSDKEATSHGVTVVPRGALSSGEKDNARNLQREGLEVLANSSKAQGGAFSTACDTKAETIPLEQYSEAMKTLGRFIETVAPLLVNRSVKVRFVNDKRAEMKACMHWMIDVLTINLAYHTDCSDWVRNYEILIHELAHYTVQSNDQLCREFYDTVTKLGAKLTQLALTDPEWFAHWDAQTTSTFLRSRGIAAD